MSDYSKALEFYEKGLRIREKAVPPNHPAIATSYNNIGGVYIVDVLSYRSLDAQYIQYMARRQIRLLKYV
ncbi:unnamed protein product [Rotaria magnacalcarata]|uniref:Uncharacterized protein n=1 Tax=Rotaria magnacalcarata TaxID=392030 RepID=A0A820DJM2_9BILA|nr:unnamed protein product [Rotaria magnacalcarata]CAF4263613.1 unnamed protein product [Rotaria magnacalcarata]